MDDPYYSHAPTLMLERPLALAGFMGARVPLTGAMLGALTGLPLVDLDRLVEHDTGRSLARIVRERGAETLAGHERRVLARVLRESPPPIVALGHATLTDARTRDMLLRGAQVIFIARPLRELAERAREEDAAALAERYALHRAGYEAAHHTIDARGLHPQRVARAVLALLGAG